MVTRKSVLHIVVDDLRDDLRTAHVQTPHLDVLRSQSLTFDRAYCQLARCAPSRHSFMTGRYPITTRVITSDNTFRGRHPASNSWRTLPEHFKLNGWLTIGMGKVFPSNSFYDVPRSWSPERTYVHYDMQRCPGVVDKHKLEHANKTIEPTGTWCALEGSLEQFIDYNLSTAALDALDFVAERRRRASGIAMPAAHQPFYLMLGFVRPHGPWMVPAHAWRRYTKPSPLPTARGAAYPVGAPLVAAHSASLYPPPRRPNASGHDELPGGAGGAACIDTRPQEPIAPWLVREARQAYYSSITWVDEMVGRVLGRLEAHGLVEETLVVLHGDHGCAHSLLNTTPRLKPAVPFIAPPFAPARWECSLAIAPLPMLTMNLSS